MMNLEKMKQKKRTITKRGKKELAGSNDISLPDNTFAPDTDCLCS